MLQHEAGQIQHPQVVAQRRAVDAELVGQRLDGERGFVDGLIVRPDDFDLAELLAPFVLGERQHRHAFVADFVHVHVDIQFAAALLEQKPARRDTPVAERQLEPVAHLRVPTSQRRLQQSELVDAVGQLLQLILVYLVPWLPRVVCD